jgi:predicted dehydrogenase
MIHKNWKSLGALTTALLIMAGCKTTPVENRKAVRLLTLDPGHFHAALVQKSMYNNVDSTVYVYAPDGPDVQLHLNRIDGFNTREEFPTRWNEVVFKGDNFFEKMLEEKAGNVVVISGNNQRKPEYISKSLQASFNVLADKPMIINANDFETLKQSFDYAAKNNLLLYDIMTERYEITTMLQREFSTLPEVFGTLEEGTPDNPSVTKESVHHFFKYVSGSILTRPPWFMDVSQQGEGIVDVTTHLVDLVQWESFPEQMIDYQKDIQINKAIRTPTEMTLSQFKAITKLDAFPDYMMKDVTNDTVLNVYSNGEINYKIKNVHAKVSVIWNYQAPEGTGDTHYSIMRGTKSNLIIKQGEEEQYKPTLYIQPLENGKDFEPMLVNQLVSLQTKFPGIGISKVNDMWMVTIPDEYKEGHEAHFGRVTEKFLEYLDQRNMPAWEVPNMIAKYYTTTKALEMAKSTTQALTSR